ncbi:kinetoplast DNA-associated protein [Trypanosoma theileri]|uniref:Kinetoplast DNA-associated protein n=1 Tax=Trypanosoma theileri TaxID=67003 RepID=A0A1X0NND5_9TRYP|nr:kinetoplast DNA-associated protein [Trypanosoma theileri]ORC85629.1 kinetoplast DNA-associated protein [Trypanosoma theileri]
MLRFCRSRLAIGAYSLFMMEQKNNPALKGLPIAQRGKVTSKLYKALSPSERTELEKRAKAMPSSRRTKETKTKTVGKTADKTAEKKRRPLSKYAQFVKVNLPKYSQLPHKERLAAVAKLWKQQQQQVKK